MELFEEVQFPHSLGLFYSAITSYLGFDVNDAEYKVMGLAPSGRPHYLDQMRALVEDLPGGQFRLNLQYFDFLSGARMFSEQLCTLFGREPRTPESELDDFTRDVARSARRDPAEFERATRRLERGLYPEVLVAFGELHAFTAS